MDVLVPVLLFLLGLALLIQGGNFFVDASSWIAEISGIPKLIVGATIVSLATTLPELIVSLLAVTSGRVDMAIGNAVGSVTVNTGLVMALTLLIAPFAIRRSHYLLKALFMLGAMAILTVCGFFGSLTVLPSLLLLAILAIAIYDNVRMARIAINKPGKEERPKPVTKTVVINTVKFLLGAAGIVFGAQLLVNNGSELARMMGVSERIIGVTIVAFGTSLPELVTTITSLVKKQGALGVGNIIGANIIDLTLILPACALASGQALPISGQLSTIDLPFCLLIGAIALVPTLITRKFHRLQGAALLLTYGAYVAITVTRI